MYSINKYHNQLAYLSKVPVSPAALDRKCCIFGLVRKKIVYAPWEQIKNASDRMFVTFDFGSGDNLHASWDIL